MGDANLVDGLDNAVEELAKNLQSGLTRARFTEIYRICRDEFSGDLERMNGAYEALAQKLTFDKPVYAAWLKQITFLHRLEGILGAEVVRSYVAKAQAERKKTAD